DGESNEGQIWEAAATAAHYNLDNLTVFVDMNGLQNDGYTREIMSMESMPDKWKAFGWNVLSVDGHNIVQVINAIDTAKSFAGKPTVILCKTVKGKGVSFMESVVDFHGKAPDEEQYIKAKKELQSAM
ncbi:MAG TPA: thiamine pyrophosphate-dependent enzyme, partial [Clostridia bacterium]